MEEVITKDCSPLELLLRAALVTSISLYVLAFFILFVVCLYNFLEIHFLGDLVRGFRGDPVSLTYNPSSVIYEAVASKCPTLHGRFASTPWLSSPHLQTAFLTLFGRTPRFGYRRQIFHVPDGGTIALDWVGFSDVSRGCSLLKDVKTPIVAVVPGLTSDSAASYIKHLSLKLAKRGWNVVVCNHRGLGGISVSSDRFYNAGWTEDLRKIINYLHEKHPQAPLFVVGTSIGANIVVKYLGEEGENTPIAGAASICSPWDLVICDRFINRTFVQRLYSRIITIGLQGYASLHQPVYARLADWEGIKKSRSVRDFDQYATCLVGNFETVDTYYRHCSSASFVENVSVPLLCISALDDPLCTKEAIPWDECRANKNVVLATTPHGGHLAFYEGLTADSLWWVRALDEFLSVLHSGPFMHKQKKIQSTMHISSTQSEIDKGPYVDVTEDGMIAAVGSNPTAEKEIGELAGDLIIQDNEAVAEAACFNQVDEERESDRDLTKEAAQSSGQASQDRRDVNLLRDVTTPIVKCLKQLSRRSRLSMWFLAYIAILTTWPLLGSLLLAVLKRKRHAPSRTG
ncbi:hypothetical protein H6P81_015303 [Aristolochia fimbriata]|uniref:AB hydrolase-1 domain-containing protein n=1 Tax=Aristolochia fimbriata TaxID=158543 RepID=A0AAV7E565_ARIFI|nr:hypothetical protein H6P81_015303 [Aristolochia fimbriata]